MTADKPNLDPADVAEALALDLPDDLDTEPLRIPDKRHANRALRRLAILDRDKAQIEADAAAEIADLQALIQPELDRITEFVADRVAGIERARAWTLAGLEAWARAHHEATGEPTVKVTGGELRLRKNPDRLAVVDAETVAKVMPEAIKAPTVDVAMAKRYLHPGDRLDPDTDAFPEIAVPDGYWVAPALNAAGDPVPGVVFLVADAKRFEWEAK